MKGIIFNEFLEFIEKSMTYTMVDNVILDSNLESGGAYTSIGTYNSKELFCLVDALSKRINKSPSQILIEYGEYLFNAFVERYPHFFQKKTSTFNFLSKIENHIHVEVKKFYQDVDLPHFQTESPNPSQLILMYKSPRHLADFAEGLIRGCIKYHGEKIDISRQDYPLKKGAKSKFILTKKDLQ